MGIVHCHQEAWTKRGVLCVATFVEVHRKFILVLLFVYWNCVPVPEGRVQGGGAKMNCYPSIYSNFYCLMWIILVSRWLSVVWEAIFLLYPFQCKWCVSLCVCVRANVQDAQEFSKLFLSVLESALVQGPLGQPSNVVQEQFAGTYCYITRSVY